MCVDAEELEQFESGLPQVVCNVPGESSSPAHSVEESWPAHSLTINFVGGVQSVDKRMQEGLAEVMGASLTLAMSRKLGPSSADFLSLRRRKGRPTSTQYLSPAIAQRGEKLIGSILPLSVSLSVDHRSAGRCAESLSTKLHSCRKGSIYLRLRKRPEAASAFITSLQSYPCNWSAYIGLSSCISSIAELETILPTLPRHPFTTCFEIHTKLDLHSGAERVGELVDELERDVFSVGLAEKGRREGKTWVWGAGQKAMIAYHLRGTCTSSLASRVSLRRWLTPLPFFLAAQTSTRPRAASTRSKDWTHTDWTTSTRTQTCSTSFPNSANLLSWRRSTARLTAIGQRRAL